MAYVGQQPGRYTWGSSWVGIRGVGSRLGICGAGSWLSIRGAGNGWNETWNRFRNGENMVQKIWAEIIEGQEATQNLSKLRGLVKNAPSRKGYPL